MKISLKFANGTSLSLEAARKDPVARLELRRGREEVEYIFDWRRALVRIAANAIAGMIKRRLYGGTTRHPHKNR